MADIDSILDKYADKINTNFESKEPEDVSKPEVKENVESENGIIGDEDITKASVLSYFDMNPDFTSSNEDKIVDSILNYVKKKGKNPKEALRELELLAGSPEGQQSRIEHIYKHIKIQEVMNATEDSNSRQ